MEFGHGKEEEDSTNTHNMLSMTSTCSFSSSRLHPLRSSSAASSSRNAEAAAAAAAAVAAVEKEHMFDKVATPSDVGKLNRLVIPKQHAERHFPLDHSANEKGLLLSFEDPAGKPWLFRYSYWNSSQSYVMTKGWSRFVKEKGLGAGDTVSFSRGVGESVGGRYFIDWKRRRPAIHDPSRLLLHPRVSTYPFMPSGSSYPMVSFSPSAGPWAGRLLLPIAPPPGAVDAYDPRQRYSYRYGNAVVSAATSSSRSRHFGSAAAAAPPDVAVRPATADARLGMTPVVQQKAAAKRVTLFGVNLDFQETDRQHPYQRPAPLQLQQQQQQQQQQQAFSSSSSSPSSTEQSLDLGL